MVDALDQAFEIAIVRFEMRSRESTLSKRKIPTPQEEGNNENQQKLKTQTT